MKKFLLSALIAAGALSASAQSFELYLSNELEGVTPINYQKISEGDVFEITEFEIGQAFEFGDYYMQSAECMAYLRIDNKTNSALALSLGYTIEKNENNSAEVGDNSFSFITCAGGSCVDANPFTVNVAAGASTPGGFGEHLGFEAQCNKPGIAEKLTIDAKYNFTLSNGGEALHFAIVYKAAGEAGVEGITTDDTAAEYYNMQGIRVANPEQGQLYIVRKGNKTFKTIL